MEIRCPSCSKLFRVADEKIAGKGIRFKCSKCAEIITITKDDYEMDLLAREAEATEPEFEKQPTKPATIPSPQAPPEMPARSIPPQPVPSPEQEAREYVPPPQEPDIPPAALNDFDFSEPHAAAAAAAHPAEGFGGQDFSFNDEPEQDATPAVDISPEAAAEAEAALQFPDDLISEPIRKPVFGAPSAKETEAVKEPLQEPEQEPVSAPPVSGLSEDLTAPEDDIDLGAALAMPKEPMAEPEPAAPAPKPEPVTAPEMPKGPVITPELMAEMMKRSTMSGKSAAQAKATASAKAALPAEDDFDLGAALAMPKSAETPAKEEARSDTKTAAETHSASVTFSGNRALIIGGAVLVLITVLAALYYLGFLWGKNEQEALQKPQQVSQPKTSPAPRQEITPDGLSIVEPAAYVDPERGDIVITGTILNTTDKPKAGWYLVTEVRDAKENVLTTVKMVNGVQLYTDRDRELLVKRGAKVEDVRNALQKGPIPARESVKFELRVLGPPAGSAGFLPALRTFDPATLK